MCLLCTASGFVWQGVLDNEFVAAPHGGVLDMPGLEV